MKFQIDGSNNYLFQEMSSITEKSQFQKLRMIQQKTSPKSRRDTGEDRMMIERYSQNLSKVRMRYRRGQDDDGKVQQKPVQSPEEIQERTG